MQKETLEFTLVNINNCYQKREKNGSNKLIRTLEYEVKRGQSALDAVKAYGSNLYCITIKELPIPSSRSIAKECYLNHNQILDAISKT